MKFAIYNKPRQLPLIGYIEQTKTNETTLTAMSVNKEYKNLEYLVPFNTKKPISSASTEGIYFGYIGSSEDYVLIVPTTSGLVTFNYTFLDGDSDSDIHIISPYNSNGIVEFTTPEAVAAVKIIISSNTYNCSRKAQVFKRGLEYKMVANYKYYYISKYPTIDIDNIKLLDSNDNIFGESYYKITELDGSYIRIESDIIKSKEMFLIYSTDSIQNRKEPIDPTLLYFNQIDEIESATQLDYPIMFIDSVSNPSFVQLLCGYNFFISNVLDDLTTTYSSNFLNSPYYLPNGAAIINKTKVIKERAKLLTPSKIAVQRPIRYNTIYNGQENRIIPTNIYDPYTTNNQPLDKLGLNIYINGNLTNNTIIKYIQGDEGYIYLNKDILTENIEITYTTDIFSQIGVMSKLFDLDKSYQFVILPNNQYISHVNGIYSNNLYKLVDDIPVAFEYSNSGYVYDNTIKLCSGDILTTWYIGNNYSTNLVINGIVYGALDYSLIAGDNTVISSGTIDGTSTNPYTTSIISALEDYASVRVDLEATTDTVIHDIQIISINEMTNAGVYYSSDSTLYESSSIYSIIDPTNSGELGTIYKRIGNIRFYNDNNKTLYNFIDINKRGGGLVEDNIIKEKLGFDRITIYPNSMDYGDIASNDDMPFNPNKYLIITLPSSILTTLIEYKERIKTASLSELERKEIIRTIYNKVREFIPSGSYFKIYDENNNEWESE